MLSQFTCATVRMLDWLAAYMLRPDSVPAHQRIGRRARRNAYFYLRKLGVPNGGAQLPFAPAAGGDRSDRVGEGCVGLH
jgi:hypothetical protein